MQYIARQWLSLTFHSKRDIYRLTHLCDVIFQCLDLLPKEYPVEIYICRHLGGFEALLGNVQRCDVCPAEQVLPAGDGPDYREGAQGKPHGRMVGFCNRPRYFSISSFLSFVINVMNVLSCHGKLYSSRSF